MNLDGYVRVSEVGGRSGDSFQSPSTQIEKIEHYGKAHGHSVHIPDCPTCKGRGAIRNKECKACRGCCKLVELDISGGKMNRPILDSIIERVKRGESDGIIVSKVNRFARTLLGGLTVIKELQEADGILVSVTDNIDLSTPTGRMVANILLAIAQMELERIKEEWSDARRKAVEKGIFTSTIVPFGWKKGDDRRLYHSDDAPMVREMYAMRKAGKSYHAIAQWLNKVAPLPTGGNWLASSVQHILSNRIYRGELISGDCVNATAYKPIITEPEWQAAQIKGKPQPRNKHEILLTGLVRCAGCRYVMSPTITVTKWKGRTYRTPVYRCRGKHGAGNCPAPTTIARKKLEPYVEAAFLEQMAGTRLGAEKSNTEHDEAVTELERLEDELRLFATDTTAREALGETAYHTALRSRSEGVEDARARVKLTAVEVLSIDLTRWADLSVTEQRQVMSAALDVVFVRRGSTIENRTLVVWRGDLEDDLPRTGGGRRQGPITSATW
jgi:site-specific DNA recombinase